MNLIFKTIEIDNFMSIDKETIDFTKYNGINLITGINNDIPDSKNGVGKTSILNALVFSIYGKMVNQMKVKTIGNRFLPVRKTVLKLKLESNGCEYTIISGIKKSGGGYCEVYDSDGNDLTKSSVDATRTYIEKNIIGIPFGVFLKSFILNDDHEYNFFCMSKSAKKLFIEQIFDLGIIGELFREIHKDRLLADKKYIKFETVVNKLKSDISDLERKMADDDKKDDEFNELVEKEKKFKQVKNTIDELLSKYPVDKLKLKKKSLDESHSQIASNKIDTDSKIRFVNSKIKNILQRIMDKQEFAKNYSDMYKTISEHSKPIVSDKLGFTKVKKELAELREKHTGYLTQLTELQGKLSKLVIPKKEIDDVKNLDKLLRKLDEKLNKQTQINNQLKIIEAKIETFNNYSNTYIDLISDKNSTLDKEMVKYNDIVKEICIFNCIEKGVGEENIRKSIIKDLVGILNNQIQYYLTTFGSDYTCIFNEDFDYQFITKNGIADYQSFSGGEKKRLSIATSFAFRDFIINRTGINSNVLMIDEYIDSGIDELAITEIFKTLRQFCIQYNQNIFVVSHRDVVKSRVFDNVINLEKTNGISKIVGD